MLESNPVYGNNQGVFTVAHPKCQKCTNIPLLLLRAQVFRYFRYERRNKKKS